MVHLTGFQVFRSVWSIHFLHFLQLPKRRATRCTPHVMQVWLITNSVNSPNESGPPNVIYILSTSDKSHLTVLVHPTAFYGCYAFFDPLIVLCRIMFGKWNFIPQLIYSHFAVTLRSIVAWYKFSQCCGIFVQLQCLALFILSVMVTTCLKYMLTWKLPSGPFYLVCVWGLSKLSSPSMKLLELPFFYLQMKRSIISWNKWFELKRVC